MFGIRRTPILYSTMQDQSLVSHPLSTHLPGQDTTTIDPTRVCLWERLTHLVGIHDPRVNIQ